MAKTATIKIPEWLDERLVEEAVRRLVEAEEARRRVEEIIGRLGLGERDLEEFERFREELWRKEGERYLS